MYIYIHIYMYIYICIYIYIYIYMLAPPQNPCLTSPGTTHPRPESYKSLLHELDERKLLPR